MTATIRCVSPVNGEVYAERPALSFEEAMGVVTRAREAQKAWAKRPIEERVALVQEGVRRLEGDKARIVEELAWQMGRPVRYGGEFGGVNERAGYMGRIAAEALAPMVAEDSDRFVRKIEREPVGVVFVIAPWNYPYLTSCNTIIPALIAGNAVVHKSASQTLLVGERWVDAFDGVLPEGVFQNVVLDHEGAERLIRERAFGFVNFTGSVNGGRAIERAAAGTFTPLGLELGGKDPGYVMEDADLDWAVDVLMDGAMFNAGQCCCGIERIYVHRSKFDEFVDRAVSWTKQLRLGNPLDVATSLGPMANIRFAREVRAQVEEAVAAGAKPLIGKGDFPADDGGTYLAPQILVNVDHSMRVMRDESFGPVVGVMPVDGDDQALELMNDSPYGLTASLWTKDPERAMDLGGRIETGTVFLNRADYLDPAVCWTGVKDTGRGAALSVLGYHSVTRPKSYHFRKQKA